MTLNAKDAPDPGNVNREGPFRLTTQLNEQERMLADTARDYAQIKLQPRAISACSDECTDPAFFTEIGESGLPGATIAEAYDGLGASCVSYGLIAREIERVDSGYRLNYLETVSTYEGAHDVLALIPGRAITGLQAFC